MDFKTLVAATAFLAAPVFIFLIYAFFNKSFFGFDAYKMAAFSFLLIYSIFFISCSTNITNLLKGIPNTGYWNNESSVYYNGRLIKGVSPTHFEEIDYSPYLFMKKSKAFMTDGESIFFEGKKIPEASKNDFQFLAIIGGNRLFKFGPKHYYSKSSKNHYINLEILDVDYDSFSFLDDIYAKDKNNFFYFDWRSKRLKNVDIKDPQSFNFLENTHWIGRDKINLYLLYYGKIQIIQNADKDSFQALDSNEKSAFSSPHTYYKDNQKIFYLGSDEKGENYSVRELIGADYESFVVTGYNGRDKWDAKDKSGYFWDGKRISQENNP